MAEISQDLWNEMLFALKDVSNWLQKEADSEMEKTELADRPVTGEDQAKKDPIKGGKDPNGGLGEDVIKAEKPEDEEDEEEEDEEDEEEEDENKKDIVELKSLLKEIRKSVAVNQEDIVKAVLADVKKALPTMLANENNKMLRKMGMYPSTPDIMRLGIDEGGINNSVPSADIQKSMPDAQLSWQELAKRREALGGFSVF